MTSPIVPGAREPYLAPVREPGAMGGAANGGDIRQGDSTMDAITRAEHRKEGGGTTAPRGGAQPGGGAQ